jgi:hypothetical protein
LLPQDHALFDGRLAGSIDQVSPAVSKVSQPLHLASVVPPHVAPDLPGAVMAQPSVELDVESVLLDEYVEILGAASGASNLSCAGGQPMATSKSGVVQLQRRLGTRPQVG